MLPDTIFWRGIPLFLSLRNILAQCLQLLPAPARPFSCEWVLLLGCWFWWFFFFSFPPLLTWMSWIAKLWHCNLCTQKNQILARNIKNQILARNIIPTLHNSWTAVYYSFLNMLQCPVPRLPCPCRPAEVLKIKSTSSFTAQKHHFVAWALASPTAQTELITPRLFNTAFSWEMGQFCQMHVTGSGLGLPLIFKSITFLKMIKPTFFLDHTFHAGKIHAVYWPDGYNKILQEILNILVGYIYICK